MRQVIGAAALFVSVLGTAVAAQERVDLELVLLADASRSIDDAELRFQRQGYAAALVHPEILGAIAQGYEQRIAVTYVEWGDASSQEVVVPWTIIDGPASAAAFVDALLETPRQAYGPNAIGSALAAAQALIESNGIDGYRQVIDLSADSANSFSGIPLAEARASALANGIVINGLAVLCREQDCTGRPNRYDLEAAFAHTIIGGPGSFVVTADGDDQFAAAVRRKLLLEIAGIPPDPATPGIRLAERGNWRPDHGSPTPRPQGK